MNDDDKALVERLRGDWPEILVEKHWMMDSDAIDKQREEAADRIETLSKENDRLNANLAVEAKFVDKLSAENERLREILREVTPPPHFGESEQNRAWWAKARAALGETK